MVIYFVLAEHCVQLWQVLSQLRLTALFYRGYYHIPPTAIDGWEKELIVISKHKCTG